MSNTTDTLVEILAIGSPSGRVSKYAMAGAQRRLSAELFADLGGHLPHPSCPQPSRRDTLLARATELRRLSAMGMHPRKFAKLAAQLEAEAGQCEVQP